jgi:hypothetical protein
MQLTIDYRKQKQTARERLFDLLSDLEWHSWDELSIAGSRPSARLLELKADGFLIESEPLPDKNGGKRYRLTSLSPGPQRSRRVKAFFNPNDVEQALQSGQLTDSMTEALQAALNTYLSNQGRN